MNVFALQGGTMFIEKITLSNFRCFGPESTSIGLSAGLTAFVGVNGAGKTAAMLALQRMFGISAEQRRIKRQDFHVALNEPVPAASRTFFIEAFLAFPELDVPGADDAAIPEFFHQMSADVEGKLKCRLRLEATWTDDGSLEGSIDTKYQIIRTFGVFGETDCIELKSSDRSRIQLIYVPASRDAASQVASFLRGRLWRAINWSDYVRETFATSGETLNTAFDRESAVGIVTAAMKIRWQEVHSAGTDTTQLFRPIDLRFQEFIRKVEVVFNSDEEGRSRSLEDLSDGQRSLFHLAMTAAIVDVESRVSEDAALTGFQSDAVPLPALTLIAVEEPENNLAPFYLSRIVRQIEDLTKGSRAQAIISSHSPSILARIDPNQVRHFRIDRINRVARVRPITLPPDEHEQAKFVREAVRTYPELYFARFVVLGEGASEEVVIPPIADALNLPIDRSFVAVVPLGGRHVNHLWKLLNDLEVPHATLLDLDWGRHGGGWGRIKNVCVQLIANGVAPTHLLGQIDPRGHEHNLAVFDNAVLNYGLLIPWIAFLKTYGVFFCTPLDLDFSMLQAFLQNYQVLEAGQTGPSGRGEPRTAVLGENAQLSAYDAAFDPLLHWYRYLFLGRGKPSTHVQALGRIPDHLLAAQAPAELKMLIDYVVWKLELIPRPPTPAVPPPPILPPPLPPPAVPVA